MQWTCFHTIPNHVSFKAGLKFYTQQFQNVIHFMTNKCKIYLIYTQFIYNKISLIYFKLFFFFINALNDNFVQKNVLTQNSVSEILQVSKAEKSFKISIISSFFLFRYTIMINSTVLYLVFANDQSILSLHFKRRPHDEVSQILQL